MTLREFAERYYLHDSSILEIVYNEKEMILQIKMDFCNWMQEGYDEKEPEVTQLQLCFNKVSHFTSESKDVMDSDVLEIHVIDDETLEWVMTKDSICFLMHITAGIVEVVSEEPVIF